MNWSQPLPVASEPVPELVTFFGHLLSNSHRYIFFSPSKGGLN